MNDKDEPTLEDIKEMTLERFMLFFQHRAPSLYSLAYGTLGTRQSLRDWMVEPNNELDGVPIEIIMQSATGTPRVKQALEDKAQRDRKESGKRPR